MTFEDAFKHLTGNLPFPWQASLYERFISDRQDNIPSSCSLPTGLGKTSVVAVWLLALAEHKDKVPRRLVYVVNRRTVVDQTTSEVEKYRAKLQKEPALSAVQVKLAALCALPLAGKEDDPTSPVALSTLRGQFADNREWSADPARAAVIVGTVDMIGSRLLFNGYGIGFKGKPLHAGFLGQDVLLVHDEAHLEPAFQQLLNTLELEQQRCRDFRRFRVLELTATSRGADGEGTEGPFELTREEHNVPDFIPDPPTDPVHHVWRRLKAKKGIQFHAAARGDIAKEIGERALRWKNSGKAILVFVRTVEDVGTVQVLLEKEGGGAVQVLTGTLRGLERDELAERDEVFARFLPDPKAQPKQGTVYLVCTSAGEVGVDISADHMVCDLTTLDSMSQRLGRVNRRGGGASEIDIVYETDRDPKPKSPEYEQSRWKSKELLERLPVCDWQGSDGQERLDASPFALRNLFYSDVADERQRLAAERLAAFAPPPTVLPASDILFDAWALTTIRSQLPGRPPVEPYLHGLADWEPAETRVAWREEVELITGDLLALHKPEDLLDVYPLKPHELLREPSYRAFKHFQNLAKRWPDEIVWLLDDQGGAKRLKLEDLADKDNKDQINYRTVILPPRVGGLKKGMLDGATQTRANDVADEWYLDKERTIQRRKRVRDGEPVPESMRLVCAIDMSTDADDTSDDESEAQGSVWLWYTLPRAADDDLSRTAAVPIPLQSHVDDVTANVERIAKALDLPEELEKPLIIAAKLHDLGKRRTLWQRSIGNPDPSDWHAKSGRDPKTGKRWRPLEITKYRHEFGSLLDVLYSGDEACAEFEQLDDDAMDLVLHLIAAHHGRGRPHFPADEDEQFDPQYPQETSDAVAVEVPRRFARLQRKFGRWGLAYIESLLRAADWAASASPSLAKRSAELEPEAAR